MNRDTASLILTSLRERAERSSEPGRAYFCGKSVLSRSYSGRILVCWNPSQPMANCMVKIGE